MAADRRGRIGVLAVQGAFRLHRAHIEAAGADYVEVGGRGDFDSIDGLILPGGESGSMLKLIAAADIERRLRDYVASAPTWGICAGAILLAKTVRNPAQRSLGAIDIVIERNAYGRQQESFAEALAGYRVAFIRAPKVLAVGVGAIVKGRRGLDPVWVEAGRIFVTTFHPEVNGQVPSPWHTRFVGACKGVTSCAGDHPTCFGQGQESGRHA